MMGGILNAPLSRWPWKDSMIRLSYVVLMMIWTNTRFGRQESLDIYQIDPIFIPWLSFSGRSTTSFLLISNSILYGFGQQQKGGGSRCWGIRW